MRSITKDDILPGKANNPSGDECLVADPRGKLTPTQAVEQRLLHLMEQASVAIGNSMGIKTRPRFVKA